MSPDEMAGGAETFGPVVHRADLPPLDEARQVAFFDAVLERAEEAERRLGVTVVHLAIADTVVALRIAGDALGDLIAPLSHLVVADTEPDAVVHLWDTRSSRVEMLPPPVGRDCFTDRGDIWRMTSPRIRSAFHWIEFSLNLFDLERKRGVFWVNDPAQLPYWTRASPLRSMLHWWMELNDCQLLHGAAMGSEDGAVLITGKGGVGKSTTSLACLDAGMQFIGDDYVVVRLEPEPRVYSLYSTAKLDHRQAERFPALRTLISNAGRESIDEKTVVQLHPARAAQLAHSLPLVSLLTPTFGGREQTTFTPVAQREIQHAASFTTMSQLPHSGTRTHAFMAKLVQRLPTARIELGSDIPAVPRAIARHLTETLHGAGAVPVSQADDTRPLLTVVMPVFNGAHFLGAAVDCVLRQEYANVEIIVVDDESTDDLAGAIARLPTSVRCFRQDNAGPAAARNRGIRDASGEFLAFLDIDDLWPDGTLSRLADRLLAQPEVDVIRGFAQLMRAGADDAIEYVGNPLESFPHYIGAGVYRRRVFETVGLFDARMRFGEDSDWYTRAAETGANVQRVDETTLLVRRHDGNMTRGKSLQELELVHVLKRALDRKRAAHAAPPTPATGAAQ